MSFEVSRVYPRLTDTITKCGEDRDRWFNRTCNAVTLGLLHEFGWVRLTREESVEDGKAARLRSIERLPLGDAMFAVTAGMSSFPDRDSESLRETLQPFFPEWERSLVLPEPEYRDGEFTLKLACGKVWRRLVAPADTTLDALAHALLDAFEFDHSHLYEFEFRDRAGQRSRVACPMISEGEMFADEMRLGDLPLDEGESFTLVYDFGDDWQFNINIEQIGDSPSRRRGPKVIKRCGTAPKQYDLDDWDD